MTKQLLFICLLTLTLKGYSQTEKNKINNIGISIPIIWNNSEATYYRLGSPHYPNGNAISYGLNINYSRALYKSFYGKIGVGYFKQTFGIKRPFNYDSPIQFGWATRSYNYYNAHLYGGSGPGGRTATTTGATNAPLTGLTNGTAYTFTVKTTNAAGSSPASLASAVVTPKTVPGAPTPVAATPTNTAAAVSWTAPSSNGGASPPG